MDESANAAKNDGAKKVGEHLMHGLEDAAEVAGHGVAGAVKGVADGVESASAVTKARNADSD
jgi:hypothetical protein